MRLSKKRLLIAASGLTGVGAAAVLLVGTTFGFFSANTSANTQSNSFATGTVMLGTPSLPTTCSVTNMVPGDESGGYSPANANLTDATEATCEYQVQYTGSAPAYIGLTATLNSSAAGSLGGTLLWQITSETTATSTTGVHTQPGPYATAGVINANGASSPLYVAADAGNGTGDQYYTFWVDYQLPSGTTNQSLSNQPATLTLEVYAVQQGNNGTGSCSQGTECTNVSHWS